MIETVSNKFTIIRSLNQLTDLQTEGQGDFRPGSPLGRSNHRLYYYGHYFGALYKKMLDMNDRHSKPNTKHVLGVQELL